MRETDRLKATMWFYYLYFCVPNYHFFFSFFHLSPSPPRIPPFSNWLIHISFMIWIQCQIVQIQLVLYTVHSAFFHSVIPGSSFKNNFLHIHFTKHITITNTNNTTENSLLIKLKKAYLYHEHNHELKLRTNFWTLLPSWSNESNSPYISFAQATFTARDPLFYVFFELF